MSHTCERADHQRSQLFYGALGALVICAFVGLGLVAWLFGDWWPLPLYAAFWVFYQLVCELMVHCPHCPHWQEDNPRIHCTVNAGIPKPKWRWIQRHLRYQSAPYSQGQRALMHACNFFSVLFPLAVVLAGLWQASSRDCASVLLLSGELVVFLALAVRFMLVLKRRFCACCDHGDCPMQVILPRFTLEPPGIVQKIQSPYTKAVPGGYSLAPGKKSHNKEKFK